MLKIEGLYMKRGLLIASALGMLALAGCRTSDTATGSPSFEYETSAGRGMGLESDQPITSDPRGGWESWRFGGDTDRIPPRLPVSPHYATPPAPSNYSPTPGY